MLSTAIIAVGIWSFAVLCFANAALDSKPVTVYENVVTDKWIRTSKNSLNYNVEISLPPETTNPLKESLSLRIAKSDFEKVQIGKSQMRIEVGQGWLQIPWVKSSNLSAPTNAEAAVDAGAGTAAAAGRENSQVTGEMRREFWSPGAKKSEEPIVRGEIHGLAHYWHANGKLYGAIPYENGKKHGSFDLFRDDGTLEQHLSYKGGVPDGVLRWYDAKGKLKQEAVYVDGQVRP